MEVAAPQSAPNERRLIDQLRSGDEAAFAQLVETLTPSMLRVARGHVPSAAVAEEVVQDTWLGVLRGLDRFEGRSSLKTWVFTILVNRARTRGVAEHRTVPFATLAAQEVDERFSAVDPERFLPADHDRWPHHWATPPRRSEHDPQDAVSHAEALELVREAIGHLPVAQRTVIVMRDVEGFTAEEVCDGLGLTPGNQRVLLHRARCRVRDELERHLAP